LDDLKSDFAIKDLGPLHYFLGIEVQSALLMEFFFLRLNMPLIHFIGSECYLVKLLSLLWRLQKNYVLMKVINLTLMMLQDIGVF
jgi:hypothetical protein